MSGIDQSPNFDACMVEDPGDLLELDDFIVKDPFHNILLRKKDDDSRFFYVHSDYWQYLQYLNIRWGRIKEEYKTILAYHHKSLELTSKYEPSNAQGQDLNNVNIQT